MRILLTIFFVTWSWMAVAENFITLASTTSTDNSGLYDEILPIFERDTGISVRVVAVGTGQAIKLAENGDADALLVHHRPSEEAFVAAGFGLERHDVMFNDFVLIGPKDNPAGIHMEMRIPQALAAIERSKSRFVSRGDNSGTHKKEQELWGMANLNPSGSWYLDVGRGMGAALNIAAAQDAYILSDRGTWLAFSNRQNLELLYEGDPPLFNPYGLILVNPAVHPHTKAEKAEVFKNWITSEAGQSAIANFRVDDQQLFFPNAAQD